jgi:hypothetical protein
MSEENKQESGKNSRGEVGPGTPATKVKALWRAEGKGMSLKKFARSIVKDNADAKRWLENKTGKHDTAPKEANVALAKVIAAATKAAKRKKKGEGGK